MEPQDEVIHWIAYPERPKESKAYLYKFFANNTINVEINWYDSVNDVWYEGLHGDIDRPVDHPAIWAEMPKGEWYIDYHPGH